MIYYLIRIFRTGKWKHASLQVIKCLVRLTRTTAFPSNVMLIAERYLCSVGKKQLILSFFESV